MSTIDDAGLALLVLNSCAYLYSARGENQPAAEISNLVAGHFATWNEIKRQASDYINNLGSSLTSQAGAGDEEHIQENIWQLIHRLLETDFIPS